MLKILLATDSKPGADGAIRFANTLSRETGASVEVLRALEPIPVVGEGSALGSMPLDTREGAGRVAVAMQEVTTKIRSFGAPAAGWPVSIVSGPAAYAIVHAAEERGARLILLGTGRHHALDRWLGTETATRVAHLSHIPLMTVPQDGGARPRTVVAAVDFSEFSRRAIEEAISVIDPDARIHLVHVLWMSPGENPHFEGSLEHRSERDRIEEELAEWAETVPGLTRFDREVHVVAGEVAREILELAARVEADLVVAGSHGHGFLGRLLMGNVSKSLLRGATMAVFLAPPPEPAKELESLQDRFAEAALG